MDTATYSVGNDFGVPGLEALEVNGFEKGHNQQLFVPEKDSSYRFRREIATVLTAWWAVETNPLWLWGPMGSGKTSALLQMAAIMNIPVQMISCHNRLESPELIGRLVLNEEGGMDVQDGPLTTAYRHGQLLILDEVDLLDPGTAAGLNALREGLPITVVESGEVVKPHPNFRLAVTSNTRGEGDTTGAYPGTQRMNQAFMDGFIGLEVGYPEKQVEEQLLIEQFDFEEEVADRMVSVANSIRSAFIGNPDHDGGEAIEITCSTRSLLRWARWRELAGAHPEPWKFSMERSLTWRASREDQAFVNAVIDRELG